MDIRSDKFKIIIPAFLILIIFITFLPSLENGFTNWDDDFYVIDNPLVRDISPKGIFKILTTAHGELYKPLVFLSFSVEYHFFKLDPYIYHLDNLLLHLANSLLVFLLIYSLSNSPAVAFLTGLLFGIHPMHVESVAWIAERKDMLYALFFLGALVFYLRYLKKGLNRYYWLSLALFSISLLAKPMGLPFFILLPLLYYFTGIKYNKGMLAKIAPFFLIAFLVSLLNVHITKNIASLPAQFNFLSSLRIADYIIIFYAYKLFVPLKLSCLYPYYMMPNMRLTANFWFFLILIIILFVAVAKSRKYTRKAAFGTGFFLITLLPVMQFIPIGPNIVADHYSYIPSVGIFYMVSEFIVFLYRKIRHNFTGFVVFVMILIALAGSLFILTRERTAAWKDSVSLWSDAVKKYPGTYIPIAYNNLCEAYNGIGKYSRAIEPCREAIKLDPAMAKAHYNLGSAYDKLGKKEQAVRAYEKAIEADPKYIEAYNNLAGIYSDSGQIDKAVNIWSEAVSFYQPEKYKLSLVFEHRDNIVKSKIYYNLGSAYDKLGKKEQAVRAYEKAIAIDPGYLDASNNLAGIYADRGRIDKAIELWNKALKFDPDFAIAHFNLAVFYHKQGKYGLAIKHCDRVIELGNEVDPQFLKLLEPHR